MIKCRRQIDDFVVVVVVSLWRCVSRCTRANIRKTTARTSNMPRHPVEIYRQRKMPMNQNIDFACESMVLTTAKPYKMKIHAIKPHAEHKKSSSENITEAKSGEGRRRTKCVLNKLPFDRMARQKHEDEVKKKNEHDANERFELCWLYGISALCVFYFFFFFCSFQKGKGNHQMLHIQVAE